MGLGFGVSREYGNILYGGYKGILFPFSLLPTSKLFATPLQISLIAELDFYVILVLVLHSLNPVTLYPRWTPHPAIANILDNKDNLRVLIFLLYYCYRAGVLIAYTPNPTSGTSFAVLEPRRSCRRMRTRSRPAIRLATLSCLKARRCCGGKRATV